MPKNVIDERVEDIIKLLGLEQFRKSFPHQLSVSSEQRIIIGRAFVMHPLEDEVIRLWKVLGTTVVFITHNIEEAVYLAERILIMSNKPTTIKEEVIVDLPRPRDVTDPAFTDIRRYVTEQIKWW